MVLVKSQIKELTDLKISKEVYEALEEKVKEIVKAAETRAKENGRKTLMKHDL